MKTNRKICGYWFYLYHAVDRYYRLGNHHSCSSKPIEELIHADISEAAKYGGWLSFAYALSSLFSLLLWVT